MPRWLVFCLGMALHVPAQADLGINLYGLAYHFDRSRAREAGLENEVIAGVGLRYRVPRGQRQWIFDAGVYHDSGRKTARIAGVGALWNLTERARLGAALVAFKSETYHRGDAFVAPLPLAAYEFRSLTLNFTFVPRLAGVNDVATAAAWLTWWL